MADAKKYGWQFKPNNHLSSNSEGSLQVIVFLAIGNIHTIMRKILLAMLCVTPIAFFTPPAQAGKIEPHPVTCWFFRGENLEIKNTCTEEGWSWAGGGGTSLTWEDGVKTKIQWGLQGRGDRICPQDETAIDGVCGRNYIRDPQTMQPVSQAEGERLLRLDGKVIYCYQVKQNSVCWKRVQL